MAVEKATAADLAGILGWLEREYGEDGGEGFWCNRRVIARSLDDGDLWVIRDGGEAVAFQVGDYAPAIANVRKDRQRRGYGTALFEAAVVRARRDDVNVLAGECSPRSSLPFWERRGFVRLGGADGPGPIEVCYVLDRAFELPTGLPPVEVVVGFYPEAALHHGGVPPAAVNRVAGRRREDGVVLLGRRVVGVPGPATRPGDLAIRIEEGGRERCFCKAKHDGAKAAGVVRDRHGAFYIDALRPVSTNCG